MKKILFPLFALLFSAPLFAQDDPPPPMVVNPAADESHQYTAGGFGYYFLPLASVKARYTSAGVDMPDGTSMIGVGLDYGYNSISSKLDHGVTGLLSFHYLLPQHFSSPGDTVKVAFNGYNAQFDLLGANFLKSQKVTLTGGLAWAFGRIKVTEETALGKSTFLNNYFAPEGRLEFNVRLADHFYIGARYAYRADITKTRWTRSGVNTPDLPTTNMSGTMVGAFIGYGK
jgi:hypothetical protein